MFKNKTLDYHNDKKIKRHFLNFLLENNWYNEFCDIVDEIDIFSINSFYSIFEHVPDPVYVNVKKRDFTKELQKKWETYIVPKTKTYILTLYDELGQLMRKSGLFENSYFNVTSDVKINGIYVKTGSGFIKSWEMLIKNKRVREIINELPLIKLRYLNSHETAFFLIDGFNNKLIDITLQE